jgi:chemotaxis protein methyltransferase CheR
MKGDLRQRKGSDFGRGLGPMPLSSQLRHIVFPVQARRSRPVNLASGATALGLVPPTDRPLTAESGAFLSWLFDRAGLKAGAYRSETLLRRLPSCLRLLRAVDTEHARMLLEQRPSLIGPAISVMLVGVTSFFRDPDVFDWLAREGLQPRPGDRPGLYVWSAGCSDGPELYSIALLLAEAGLLDNVYLLGTDCRPDAIDRARQALYDEATTRTVPQPLLERYFECVGTRRQVVPAIRRQLRWAVTDVLKGIEPGAWDVILFRNTAMYCGIERLAELWSRLETSLRPGGLLVLGRAERPFGVKRLTPVRPCVYRRVRGGA